MIKISNHFIGKEFPPFIIAEMSGNHNQSLERALEIVDAAASAGVHALKLQTYTADLMTLNINTKEFLITDYNSPWNGKSLYDLYKEAYTPWDWHRPIFDRCRERGIIGFSTPFDATAVDFLEKLDVPCYKIASFENVDLPLIKKVAETGKPIIISTGMASIQDLFLMIDTARNNGCNNLILLKCTSSYPSTPENSNLNTIPHLRALFDSEVGLSDHTLGIGVACASVALGATVIEKHFTLCRADGGVDSTFSLEPDEMKHLVNSTRAAWQGLGKIFYGPSESELKSLTYRRSIYVCNDIKAGEVLTRQNIKIIRPGLGISPKYYDIILGKKVNCDLKKGTPFTWNLIG